MNSEKTKTSFAASANSEDAAHEVELVIAAKAGSRIAFEELRNRCSSRLYRRIFSIMRNREDTEDTLQDTFLQAYMALKSFEGRSSFSTWITRIAINSALMTIRKRRVRGELVLEQPSENGDDTFFFDIRDTGLDPEQICDQRQRCLNLLGAIQKLDPKLRTTIRIWTTQECSMKEIANTLDVSLGAVKARLHRARRRLRGCIALKDCKMSSSA